VGSTPGVGILLNPGLADSLDRALQRVAFAPIIPDRLWNSIDPQSGYRRIPSAWAMVRCAAERAEIPLHGIGLSVGSAGRLDRTYLDAMLGLAEELRSPWISDHLSFVHLQDHGDLSPAAALPVPYDAESLAFLTDKVGEIVRASPVPFLLENPAYYIRYPEQDFSEPAFLNEICRRTGAGLLFDLHNLVCNVRNLGFDPWTYLEEIDWSRVLEIHVAGGSEMHGFWTDSHTGGCDPAVVDLLPIALARAVNLRSVTFEFHEASFPLLGEAGVLDELDRIAECIGSTTEVGAT
jgi:uncharacterized protein (UPF0276 family)